MAVDPGLDFAADRRTHAFAIVAVPVAIARCAVEEILLHATAFVRREHRRRAIERACRVVAGVRVVAAEDRAEDSSTLQVPAGALSAGASEAGLVAAFAACAVGQVLVGRTVPRRARADFGHIAGPVGSATGGAGSHELTARTAGLVRVVAHRVRRVLAGFRVAAFVVAASCCSSTVAVFAALDNAVAALAASRRHDALVVHQAVRLHAATPERRADVADGALRKVLEVGRRRWVHDVFAVGITRRRR